jgi:MFS transporter, PPP family, 3-phenylpropionic acid transporter
VILQLNKRVFVTYSAYYFFGVSLFAWTLGFLPLHLKGLGFSPFQVALTVAMGTLAVIISSASTLQIAHHWFAPKHYLLVCSAAALGLFSFFFGIRSFALLIPCWFLCSYFKRGGDALVDAQALRDSAQGAIRFEQVRLWGSVGFVLCNFAIGGIFDVFGSSALLPCGVAIFALTMIAALPVSSLLAPLPGKVNHSQQPNCSNTNPIHYNRNLFFIILTTALVYGSHSPYYSYFSIYLKALGWDGTSISLAWNIGVIAEILVFALLSRIESRLSLKSIFKIGILGTVLRWLILASTHDPVVLLCSQTLHGLSYGACYVASLKLVNATLPDHLKDRGQGLLIGLGQGLGSLVGCLIAGKLAGLLGSYLEVNKLFVGAALAAVAALLAAQQLPGQATLTDRPLNGDLEVG